MKVTVEKIVLCRQALSALASQPLPAAVAYQVARIIRAIEPELKDFEDARNRLVTELGDAGEDGAISVKASNMGRFRDEMDALVSVSIDLDVTPLDLDDISDARLTASDILSLDFLLAQ